MSITTTCGFSRAASRDGLLTVGRFRDHFALGREHHPERLAQDAMVVGEQHANPPVIFHHADSGISATSVVPAARDSTVKLAAHQIQPLAHAGKADALALALADYAAAVVGNRDAHSAGCWFRS